MIDDHVHPFALEAAPFDPADLTLDTTAPRERDEDRPRRLAVELLRTRLARFLGCAPDELAAARTEIAANWPAYGRRLLDDAGLEGMVMDPAWGPGAEEPLDSYADVLGRPVWELQRLEPTVDGLLESGADAREILDSVDDLMATAARRGCVGFKTIIAYRTGLAVDAEVDLEAAQRSLESALPVRRRGKALRDLVLRHALGRCADLGLPIQVHTGFGDSDIRPRAADPLLLDDLLRTAEGRAATIVLIHGSWPWHDALGYLASVHRNLWAEFSLAQLFAPVTTADRLLRLLDYAPTERVVLGSDGHGSVESIWYGCVLLRDAWTRIRAELAGAGARAPWVDETGRRIFTDNARLLYGLPA